MSKKENNNTKVNTKVNTKQNKLTLSNLKKSVQEKESRFKVLEINGYTVNIKEYWTLVDIQAVVDKFIQRVDFANKKELDIDERSWVTYQMFLVIGQFTDLLDDVKYDPTGEKGLSKELEIIELLIKDEYFVPIVEALPESELEKFNTALRNTAENINAMSVEFSKNGKLGELDGVVDGDKDNVKKETPLN